MLSSGQQGTKELGVLIFPIDSFPIEWGAKELLRVSQPSNSMYSKKPGQAWKFGSIYHRGRWGGSIARAWWWAMASKLQTRKAL